MELGCEKGAVASPGPGPRQDALLQALPGSGQLSLGQMAATATSERALPGPGGEEASPSAFQPSARPITEILLEIPGQDIASR